MKRLFILLLLSIAFNCKKNNTTHSEQNFMATVTGINNTTYFFSDTSLRIHSESFTINSLSNYLSVKPVCFIQKFNGYYTYQFNDFLLKKAGEIAGTSYITVGVPNLGSLSFTNNSALKTYGNNAVWIDRDSTGFPFLQLSITINLKS